VTDVHLLGNVGRGKVADNLQFPFLRRGVDTFKQHSFQLNLAEVLLETDVDKASTSDVHFLDEIVTGHIVIDFLCNISWRSFDTLCFESLRKICDYI